MKKIATLLLAAGLVFGAATGASAIDFKAKGQWIMSFDYGQNGGFTGGNGQSGFNKANGRYTNEDEFEARQRVRLHERHVVVIVADGEHGRAVRGRVPQQIREDLPDEGHRLVA